MSEEKRCYCRKCGEELIYMGDEEGLCMYCA